MRMQKGFDLCADVLFKLKRLINHSDLLVKKLHEVADELDSHHYNSAIAKVTGGAAGIAGVLTAAGGAIAAVGIFFAPVTGGLSLFGVVAGGVTAATGGAVGAVGTATVVGTQIVKKSLNNGLFKRVQQAIDEYTDYRKGLAESWKKIETMCYNISVKCKVFGAEAVCKLLWTLFKTGKKEGLLDVKFLQKAFELSVKYFVNPLYSTAIGAVIVGSAAVALNLYELVGSAIVIHEKQPHPAAVEIREKTIIEVQTEIQEFTKLRDLLDKSCTDITN
ncbi:uncharacterized protein [Dysidea avara]|uniref:uncharacterized protein n=1 Tax=Dysidea avara TaxID=196820 RepID=UPI00332EA02B